MNILVLSENFTTGGLETHINTYYKSLNKKVNFVFAFPKYKDNGYLKGAKIYTGLHLGYNITIQEFCEDIKTIRDIIKKEKIDVIHVHPFYSMFPALFAANLENIKIVYTYHGYGSINFVSEINDNILFMFAAESRLNKIFCVAKNALEYFDGIYNHNSIFLPNIIYEDDFPIHKISQNKKWALISRLDNDKYPSIIKFLDQLNELDINQVDIYGSGNMEKELIKYIKKNKLSKKVFLKGYINDLSNALDNYTGTIGLGRVVQESLCMNYPTIFIGYGKVAGVIDKSMYNKVREINFVPATLKDIDIVSFKKQIDEINNGKYSKYLLREHVIKDFGHKKLELYLNELEIIESDSIDILNKIYNDLVLIEDKNENFYKSKSVFEVLYSRLANYSKNVYFKNILLSYKRYFSVLNEFKNEINIIHSDISKIKSEFNDRINILSNEKDELDGYRNGKLYRLSSKIYSFKSKIFKNKDKK